jgi:hypothetical protein
MMAFFVIKKRPEEAMVVTGILIISMLFTVISYEEVYDLSKIDDEKSGERQYNEEAFSKWK